MNREIKWLGEADDGMVGAPFEKTVNMGSVSFGAYKKGKLVGQWVTSFTKTIQSGGGYLPPIFGYAKARESLRQFVESAWPKATALGADILCGWPVDLTYSEGKLCFNGTTFWDEQNVTTNTPVTVTPPQKKPTPLKQAPHFRQQMSPYAQTFQSIYGSPEHNPNMRWLPEE